MKQIYLDNASTTKVDKKVVDIMQKVFLEDYGNASSVHGIGEDAHRLLLDSKKDIAKILGSKPGEIYFTSGGTESNNLALQGLARANPGKKTIVISSIEHASIMEQCNNFAKRGYRIVRVPVNNLGLIDLIYLRDIIEKNKEDILLVSVMHVNNIIGTIQNIGKIGEICKKNNVIFHTDAIQSIGKLKIDVKNMNIDLLSASAHKFNGPKGVGFLYVNSNVRIEPLFYGGGQEKGLRSGTENIPGIVGMKTGLKLSGEVNWNKIKDIRDMLIVELEKIGGRINGDKINRIINNVHVSFEDIDSDNLVSYLSGKGIYVSSGSACDNLKEKEDHVLKAIGVNRAGNIRISLGKDASNVDIKQIISEIKKFMKIYN